MKRGLTLVFVLVLFVGLYAALNEGGWVPHNRETTVFMPSENWMLGEFRNCEMQVIAANEGFDYFLDCAARSGKPHALSVKYWGRLNREGRLDQATGFRFLHWRCQRATDSLICRAID